MYVFFLVPRSRSALLSSLWSASLTHTSRLNPHHQPQSFTAPRSTHRRLMRHLPPSAQPFSAHDSINPTLDDDFFMLANGAKNEWMYSISDEVLKLPINFSHYLASTSFGLYHRSIRTLHVILDTEAELNLIRYDILQIIHFCSFFLLGGATCRLLQLLGVIFLRLRLGNSHFLVPFIFFKH